MWREKSLFTVLATWLLLSASAFAQEGELSEPDRLRAQAHFEEGRAAFDRGEYEAAVESFRAAHAMTGHPDLLFNIYSAAERGGALEDAAEALEAFLEQGEMDANRREALGARLVRLRERIEAGATEPTPPPSVDEPTPAPIQPSVGEPTPSPMPPPENGPDPVGVGLLVTAGVLALSFAVFAGLSTAESAQLEDGCGRFAACSGGDIEALVAFNFAADASWIAALVAGGIGLAMVLGGGDDEVPDIAPFAGPGVVGGVARGRF